MLLTLINSFHKLPLGPPPDVLLKLLLHLELFPVTAGISITQSTNLNNLAMKGKEQAVHMMFIFVIMYFYISCKH